MMAIQDKINSLPEHLRKFVRIDGCTLFIQGLHTTCCDLHDFDYSVGIDRKFADRALRDCVLQIRKAQYEHYISATYRAPWQFTAAWMKYQIWKGGARGMYAAVRVFGWYWYGKATHKRNGHTGNAVWWPWHSFVRSVRPK